MSKEDRINVDYDDPDAFLNSGIFSSDEYEQRRMNRAQEEERLYEINRAFHERQQRNAASNERINRQIRQFQQSKNKTIGHNRRAKDANRIEHPEKHRNNVLEKVSITMCLLASLVAASTLVGIKAGPMIQNKIQMQKNIDNSTDLLVAKAYNNLAVNGLAGIDIKTGKFVVKDNSVDDYKTLGISCNANDTSSHINVYIYKRILPESEFEKFIKSVSYKNGIHYYQDMNQFLNINGYYTKGTSIPSLEVFYNMMEAEINKKAPELLKEYSAYGDVYTVEDYLEEENKEMRGR